MRLKRNKIYNSSTVGGRCHCSRDLHGIPRPCRALAKAIGRPAEASEPEEAGKGPRKQVRSSWLELLCLSQFIKRLPARVNKIGKIESRGKVLKLLLMLTRVKRAVGIFNSNFAISNH